MILFRAIDYYYKLELTWTDYGIALITLVVIAHIIYYFCDRLNWDLFFGYTRDPNVTYLSDYMDEDEYDRGNYRCLLLETEYGVEANEFDYVPV